MRLAHDLGLVKFLDYTDVCCLFTAQQGGNYSWKYGVGIFVFVLVMAIVLGWFTIPGRPPPGIV